MYFIKQKEAEQIIKKNNAITKRMDTIANNKSNKSREQTMNTRLNKWYNTIGYKTMSPETFKEWKLKKILENTKIC